MANVSELEAMIIQLRSEMDAKAAASAEVQDHVWLLTSSFLIMTMQAGFALYESGLVRAKNMHNVLLKNIIDGCVGAIFWLAFGYGIAFGTGNPVIGLNKYFGMNINPNEYAYFLFEYSFAATGATIMSGALAERVNFMSYVVMCGFINSVNYAFVAHWIWAPEGWLVNWGFYDFAGGAVVHTVGGFAGLAGAIFLGPRIGKFEIDENGKKVTRKIPMSNPGMALLGVFLLCWGWFGFNAGSTLHVSNGWHKLAAHVCLNTAFASSSGACAGLVLSLVLNRKERYIDLMDIGNGILAGLVTVTPGASVMTFWEAVLIGIIGACCILGSMRLIENAQLLDDPVGACAMHGIGGLVGLIWVGLIAHPEPSVGLVQVSGAFYGNPSLLGKQLVGWIVVATWSFSISYVLCFLIDRFIVRLRVPAEVEKLGLDLVEHRIGFTKDGRVGIDALMTQDIETDVTKSQIINQVQDTLNFGYTKIDMTLRASPIRD